VPVSEGYRDFVIEQLEQAARDVRWKRMFGGVGIYSGDDFFALIANDILYFKVDDETRPTFVKRRMKAFKPYGPDGEEMGYYEVPLSVIEDTDELRSWIASAIAVAKRAKSTPRRKRS
jgi:DNA transformation protein